MDTAAIRDADGTNTFTYQWQGGGNDISGATDTLLVLMQAEVGQTITVQVSYIDGGGTTETLTATPTTTVANINDAPTGLPTISGTPTQGGTLRVDTAAFVMPMERTPSLTNGRAAAMILAVRPIRSWC